MKIKIDRVNLFGGLILLVMLVFGTILITKQSQDVETKPLSAVAPIDQNERRCIIEALWHEARSEHEIGIRAVMSVIQNRKMLGAAKSSLHYRFPKTYCGVIYAPYQFSYRNEYSPGYHVKLPLTENMTPSEVIKLILIQDIADEVLSEKFKNNLSFYTLYYTKTNVRPKWIKKMQKVVTIDKHVFYKPKNLGTISELTATKEK